MTICSAVASGVSIQNSRKNGNSSLRRGRGADREAPRRLAVALAAAEEAEVARPEEGDHLVPDMRRVDRKAQTKAGKTEVDRQGAEFGVAVVEEIGGVGDRRRDAVAQTR